MPNIPAHIDATDDDAVVAWIESDEFEPGEWRDGTPLRRIAAADEAVDRARQRLTDTVRAAHDAGHSWTAIAAVLDITRQAARQRFGVPTDVTSTA